MGGGTSDAVQYNTVENKGKRILEEADESYAQIENEPNKRKLKTRNPRLDLAKRGKTKMDGKKESAHKGDVTILQRIATKLSEVSDQLADLQDQMRECQTEIDVLKVKGDTVVNVVDSRLGALVASGFRTRE